MESKNMKYVWCLCVAGLLTAPISSAHAQATCDGLAVTIFGTSGDDVRIARMNILCDV